MDFNDFFVALWGDWVSLMSGIASVILTVLGVVRNWDRVPRWIFLTCAGICFFFASARVWTTEHRKYLGELERNSPSFTLSLGNGISFYSPENDASIFLVAARIVNGGADSAVIDWKAHYKSASIERDVACTRILTDPYTATLPNGKPFIMGKSDQVMNRADIPIPRGGMANGWLPIIIPGREATRDADPRATISVTITDYKGKSYSASIQAGRGGVSANPPSSVPTPF
jgi:hypothetical protein